MLFTIRDESFAELRSLKNLYEYKKIYINNNTYLDNKILKFFILLILYKRILDGINLTQANIDEISTLELNEL